MHRRDVLKLGAAALALTQGMPRFLARAATLAAGGRHLVVIQLSGGNDALNTLIPFRDGAYYAARPTLAIPARQVVPVSEALAMHPNLRALAPAFDAGELAWVGGVGYPGASRSHFASMAIWHSADPGRAARDGWLARLLERYGDPLCATSLTPATPPALLGGATPAPAIDDVDAFRPDLDGELLARFERELAEAREGRAAAVAAGMRRTLVSSRRLRRRVEAYRPARPYPGTPLGRDLLQAAALLADGDGPPIVYLTRGGFDTHARQRRAHDDLMLELGDALAAFRHDLTERGLADRVLVLGFSEFGRRVAENASGGTDHGEGGAMFVLGAGVRGGVHGDPPDLEDLRHGDLKYRQDFRGVYAAVLDGWMGVPSREVLGAAFAGPDLLA